MTSRLKTMIVVLVAGACFYAGSVFFPPYSRGQVEYQYDSSGRQVNALLLTGADGVVNTALATPIDLANSAKGASIFPLAYNGTTWDRGFYCSKTAIAAGVVATTTQIVALVAAQKIRVCSFVIERTDVAAVAVTVKFVEGTGSNCASGQTSATGILLASGATAPATSEPATIFNGGPGGAFITTTAADALCVQTTGAASSFDTTISYAQY